MIVVTWDGYWRLKNEFSGFFFSESDFASRNTSTLQVIGTIGY